MKSIGQDGPNGISGTTRVNRPAATRYSPWKAAISPVTESPMTTDGRRMTCGPPLARTTCSAASFDAA
jgi:hypothetical protein